MSAAPVVRAMELARHFHSAPGVEVQAVVQASLEVHAGEVALVHGPSGSGKTTLLSLLGCLLEPTRGELWLAGQAVGALGSPRLPAFRLRTLGFVFQGFRLLDALSARENVELPLHLAGVSRARARTRAVELLEELEMGHRAGFRPEVLSGGEKQRVAIARALALDPPILLADEPTGSLDSRAGRAVIELLAQAAHARDKAVVVVSHDPRLRGFADRLLQMEDGRLREVTACSR